MKTNDRHIQGDIMLRKVERPANLRPAPQGSEVLALGKHSGHVHVAEGCDIMVGADEERYVIPRGPLARLLRKNLNTGGEADHKPLVLQEGECYQVVMQRRYNPFARVFERVID